MKPLVSVIMPVYNASAYVVEALDSVLASTYRPLEVIVMNDGSTDNSLEVVQAYAKDHTEVKVLTLDSDEQQLMVRSLYELRNSQLEKDGPVEPVEDLLLRVIDAPTKKEKRRKDREAR